MAVPKSKTSKARKRKRRAHHALVKPSLVKCKRCGTSIESHAVCHECGFYRGKSVIQIEEG